MKRVQKLLSSTLAISLTLSCILPMGVSAAKSFSDVKGHWAAEYIKSGVNRGYVNGYENGTFNPNGAVTRAEFCKMMNSALGLKNTTTINFSDISSRDWFYNDVSKAVASGYISGYDDGTFRANDKITRQEAAVVISRIVSDAASQKDVSALRDAGNIDAWALSGANVVFSKGYMGGDNQKRFNPKGKLTRGEAIKIVESILDGENISANDTYVSTSNQSLSNQVYSGNLTVSANGSSTFQNCRILGTLTVSGEGTVRLQDCKVGKLSVNVSSGKAEVIATGNTDIHKTDLATGATLTENGIYAGGFEKVNLSGSKLSSQQVTMTGMFMDVNLDSATNLSLRSGWIQNLRLASSASGSKISLLSGTRVERAELNGRGDFTGSGTIQVAILNNTGSTFETAPLRMEGKTSLIPSISPKNGATGVSVSDNIRLSFNEIPYTSSNSVVTTSYVEGSVIELRSGSETGSTVSFSASLGNNNRDMTIDPRDTLSSGTRYYVIVKSALRNSRGDVNDRMVFSFTTQNGLNPTVYPANGATNIPVSTSLRLEFGENVKQPNGNSLTSSYLKDTALELRADSKNGRLISISPSATDNRTITISTNGNLSTNTTYYLIVRSGTIANSNRDTLSEQVYSFTTASSNILVPAMTPSPGTTRVSTGTDLVLDFDTTIYTSSGGNMTTSYLENSVFTLRRDSASGNSTSLRANMNSGHTRVTLTPESLRSNTTYYLVISDGSLANGTGSNRRYNDRLVLSFTTGSDDTNGDLAPSPNPANGASGVSVSSNITLSFDSSIYRSNSSMSSISSSYLENEVLELRSDSSSGSHVGFSAEMTTSSRVTIKPNNSLSTNTRYYIIVKSGSIQNSSGLKNSRFTSYFTCGSIGGLLAPTMTPAEGSNGASPTTDITLSFGEDLYDNSGTRLSDNTTSYTHVTKYAVTLRSGSETGEILPFNTTGITNNRRVTFKPTKSLTSGTTYYVILNEGYLRNSAGQSIKRQVFRFTVGSGLTATTSPRNGDSGVSRTPQISLYFNDPIYDSSGYSISDYYIKSNLSITPSISYKTELTNGNRTLTITPTEALLANQTYKVTLPANRVMNSSGYRNSEVSFYFTTNSTALVPTITPSNGSSNVSPGSSITLAFGETLYNSSGTSALSPSDVQTAIELHRDSPSGQTTLFDASVSGGTITITPRSALERGRTYYVLLKSGGMANSSRVQNSYQQFSFTTQPETNIPAPSMSIGKVQANGSQNVTVSFTVPVSQADVSKSALTVDYLKNNLKLKNGSSELAPDNVQISDNKTITFTYNTPLLPRTIYTVSAAANVFSDASGNKNAAISVSQTTPAPVVTITKKSVGKTSAIIQVVYDYPVTFNISATKPEDGKDPILSPSGSLTPNDASGSFEITLQEMSEGKDYTANVDYTYNGVTTPIKNNISFTTEVTSTVSTLSALSVQDSKFTHSVSLINATNDISVIPASDGTVTITPAATAGSKAQITVDGKAVSSGEACKIEVKSKVTVTIEVTAEDNTKKSIYVLNLNPTP